MRILMALTLFVSFSVQAQRVRENIHQQNVVTTEKKMEQKKSSNKSSVKVRKARTTRASR